MSGFFQHLLDWVSANPHWAGVITFLMAFAESLAVVGVIVPGVAIMFALGALIGAGALNFYSMMTWAVAGAICGDGLSFWLGYRYRQQLTRLWPFRKHPGMLEKGIRFFKKYGGKSVILGRFFGPVRAVIPLVAGMMKMPRGQFLAANILSALIWAPAYLLPGMAFGASLELASEVAMRLVMVLILLVAALWFLGWLSHRLFVLIQPRSTQWLLRLLSLGDRYQPLRKITHALADPQHPESAGLAMLAGLLVLTAFGLGVLALIPQQSLLIANDALHLAFRDLSNPSADHLMLSISAIVGSSVTLAILFVGWILLLAFGLTQASRHWLAGIAGAWVVSALLEYLLRQHSALIGVLPDIYVLRASVVFGLGSVILATPLQQHKRWIIYSTATILIMAVSIAQVYLGSSLFAVLLALGSGSLWAMALGMAWRTHARQEQPSPRHAMIFAATLMVLSLSAAFSTEAPPAKPNLLSIQGEMTRDQWRQQGWRSLARYRDDFTHKRRHPLNLQLAVDLQSLIEKLESRGWQKAQTANGLRWLRLLATDNAIEELPLVPHSHNNRFQSLVLVKNRNDQRLALYLWPSHYLDTQHEQPYWLGEVTTQKPKSWMGLIQYPLSVADKAPALESLRQDLLHSNLSIATRNDDKLLLISDD